MDHSERVAMLWERGYPYAGGVAFGVLALAFHADIASHLTKWGVDVSQVISATFDVMITLTAFLFSVFVLAVAPGGGFLEKIFHTATFGIFKRYVVEALVVGAASAILCLPFMTTSPDTGQNVWQMPLFQICWSAIAVLAALSFFRVVHVFMVLIGLDAKDRARSRARKRPV